MMRGVMATARPDAPALGARLRDVADLAKVSTSTASRALSGDPRISVPTRRRVERAATRLAYRANPLARGLSMRRTFAIGLILGDLTRPCFAQLARGVDQCLHDFGYTYLLADMDGDPSRQAVLAQRLIDRHVDGLIATMPHDPGVLAGLPIPVVAVDRCPGVPSVSADDLAGGRLAADHLVAAGYRRIAILCADPTMPAVHERRRGFVEGLEAAGLSLAPEHDCVAGSMGFDDSHIAALDLLRRDPDAVFAVDDLMAAAVIAAARDLGLAVPGDLGVVGYDETPVASWRTLSLTSVDQRALEMGRAVASMVLRRVQAPDEDIASITLTPKLVVRGSSAGPSR